MASVKAFMRFGLAALGLLALSVSALAQETAVVTFTLDFPGSEPSHYVISVSSDGHSSYESDGKLSPDSNADPFHLDFSLSPAPARRSSTWLSGRTIFRDRSTPTRKTLPPPGVKTLDLQRCPAERDALPTIIPTIAAVQQITQLFQSLSTTLEYGRRLQYFHRYQKLALDEELKRMEEMANENNLAGTAGGGAHSAEDCQPTLRSSIRFGPGAADGRAGRDLSKVRFSRPFNCQAYLLATRRSKKCSNRVSEEGSLGR